MSEAACGKKAACNPPVKRAVSDGCLQIIEAVETLLALRLLQTEEIEAFIAADGMRLQAEEELVRREAKIAELRTEADSSFLERYEATYRAVQERLDGLS